MNLELNQGIKILRVSPDDGSIRSCHGGIHKWDPPKVQPDGSYLPGEWTDPVDPVLCRHGYHLTDLEGIVRWFNQSGLRAFLVEYKGKVDGFFDESRDRKIAVESCRIVRPLTDAEHAKHSVFLSGEHTVRNVRCRALGNSTVYASGNSVVFALDNAVVEAHDGVEVFLEGHSQAYARGNSVVYAYGNATVDAHDNSIVKATDNSVVRDFGSSSVRTYGASKVIRMPLGV